MTTPDLDIEHLDDGHEGSFVISNPNGDDPEYLAELTYKWRDGAMVILHTGVREALQHQGVARRLAESAIDLAVNNGFRILPRCPYAQRVFDEDTERLDAIREPEAP